MRARRSRLFVLFFILVGLLCLTPRIATAQPDHVSVDVAPAEITVGDPVQVKLTLVWDGATPAGPPRFPDWPKKTWGRAEVLAVDEIRTVRAGAGRLIYSQTLTVTAFETGEIELPPRIVALPLTGETVEIPTREGLGFLVESVLPEEAEGADAAAASLEPRPAAPLRALGGDRRFLWTATALAVLCGLAALDLRRRLQRAAAAELAAVREVPVPPVEELLRTLREIDVTAGSESAHTALSLALRRFLARSLDVNAIESTTSEIRRMLGMSCLSPPLVRSTVVLLGDCDQVKYAHLEVEVSDVRDRLAVADRLGREIERELRPREPEVGAGGAGSQGSQRLETETSP